MRPIELTTTTTQLVTTSSSLAAAWDRRSQALPHATPWDDYNSPKTSWWW